MQYVPVCIHNILASPYCEGRLKACSKCDEFFFLFSSIAISSSVRVLYVQTNISADPGLPPAVSIASVTKSFRLLFSNATSCSVRVLYVWTDISANPGLSLRQSSERVDQWESLRLGSHHPTSHPGGRRGSVKISLFHTYSIIIFKA